MKIYGIHLAGFLIILLMSFSDKSNGNKEVHIYVPLCYPRSTYLALVKIDWHFSSIFFGNTIIYVCNLVTLDVRS